ncbi:hypothetical protein F5882DRAFT_384496 [Hyaloscypha sp. PMI_1271]|nr:hypothetical protein F5882DRAFT_384496 [Hyaloscypha sp. PMI_1271]
MNNIKAANSLLKRVPGPERCMACLQGNFTPEGLQKHIQDSHDNGGKGITCSYCRFKSIDSHFESYAVFLIHYNQEHRCSPFGPSKLHQQFQDQGSQISRHPKGLRNVQYSRQLVGRSQPWHLSQQGGRLQRPELSKQQSRRQLASPLPKCSRGGPELTCPRRGCGQPCRDIDDLRLHMDAVHKDHRQGQVQGSQIRSPVVQSPQGNQKPKYLERSWLQQSSSQLTVSQVSQRARTSSHGPFRRPQPVDLGPFKDRGRLAQVGPATQTGGSGGMLRKGGLKEAKKH